MLTFFVTITVAAVFGTILSRAIAEHQMQSHTKLYPEVVQLLAQEEVSLSPMLATGQQISPEMEQSLQGFLALGTIFRIKLWTIPRFRLPSRELRLANLGSPMSPKTSTKTPRPLRCRSKHRSGEAR